MPTLTPETQAQLQALAAQRAALTTLLHEATPFGGEAAAPEPLRTSIATTRAVVAQLEAMLRRQGLPDAAEPPPSVSTGSAELPPLLLNIGSSATTGDIRTGDIAGQSIDKRSGTFIGTLISTGPDPLPHFRSLMLNKLRNSFINPLLSAAEDELDQIELYLGFVPEAVTQPWNRYLGERPGAPPPDRPAAHLSALFHESGGELLLLGEPGSGKDTLLFRLAHDLLDQATQDATYPMPVIFNLATWTHHVEALEHWLVQQLQVYYGIGAQLARDWIAGNAILPILNGLDAVSAKQRAACVQAINAFKATRGFLPLVVASRYQEYLALTEQLHLSTAVVIRPLTEPQVAAYLNRVGRADLQLLLTNDPAFCRLLSTPLMLSVVCKTYVDHALPSVAGETPAEARRQRLISDYVAGFFHHEALQRYPRAQTERWLNWLAVQLQQRRFSTFFVDALQPDWLPNERARRAFQLIDRLGAAVIAGSVIGLIAAALAWPVYRAIAPIIGLVYGALVALIMGLYGGRTTPAPHARRRLGRLSADIGLSALLFGAIGGLLFALLSALLIAPQSAMEYGLYYALRCGVLGALIGGLAGRPGLHPRRVVVSEILGWSWRGAVRALPAGLLIGTLFGLLYNLVFSVLAGLGPLFEARVLHGLGSIIVGGLLGGIGTGLMGGLTTTTLERKAYPNQGIWRSWRSALTAGLITGPIIGVVLGSGVAFAVDPAVGIENGVRYGLITGLIFALVYGGYAGISHAALRLVLWRLSLQPLDSVRFLNACSEAALLRPVCGGYIFANQLLYDHFVATGGAAAPTANALHDPASS